MKRDRPFERRSGAVSRDLTAREDARALLAGAVRQCFRTRRTKKSKELAAIYVEYFEGDESRWLAQVKGERFYATSSGTFLFVTRISRCERESVPRGPPVRDAWQQRWGRSFVDSAIVNCWWF